MEMEKKNVAIIVLAIALAASGVGNIILALPGAEGRRRTDYIIWGTQVEPREMDAHNAYDTGSTDFITQVCEQLYDYNLSDPTFGLVPTLATDFPTIEGLNLTIPLRHDVLFQDGYKFNATAVKWNFDRLNQFINYSGNSYLPAPFNVPLPSDVPLSAIRSLMSYGSPRKPLINETIVVDEYTVKIVLNIPKGSIWALLAFCGLSIMSPYSTPPNRYLAFGRGDKLVGTSPFKYDYYTTDVEVRLSAFKDYWRPVYDDLPAGASIPKYIVFAIYSDDITLNDALLTEDIDLLDAPNPENLDTFEDDPDITLVRAGPTVLTEYVCINSGTVNKTWREVLSFGIDYDYVVDTVMEGEAVRLQSPIPFGIPLSNYTLNYPVQDLARARGLINNMFPDEAIAVGDDAAWAAKASSDPFITFHMWVQDDSDERQDYTDYMCNNVDGLLGIDIIRKTTTFSDLVYNKIIYGAHGDPEMLFEGVHLDLYALGWAPDYIDPENYVDWIAHSTSALNCGYNNSAMDALIDAGVTTIDIAARKVIFDEIQRLMLEEEFNYCWLFVSKDNDAFAKDLVGWISNPLAQVDLTHVYWK